MDQRKLALLRMCGLNREADRAEAGLCPTCACDAPQDTLRDPLSLREFNLSGMCQQCQDAVFAEPRSADD